MSGIIAQNVGRHTGLVKAASGGGGVWTLIKTLTSDGSDANLTFINGTDDVVLDSTYDQYYFNMINIHPETDGSTLQFNMTTDGTNFNIAKTTTAIHIYHNPASAGTELLYDVGGDLAQGTGGQIVIAYIDSENYSSGSGYLHLFAPSDTTFVKHFISDASSLRIHPTVGGPYNWFWKASGYGNTTSAVTGIQFAMDSGEIQAGSISLYGIG